MRTNIHLDDKLIKRVMKLTNAKSKREAVHLALETYERQLLQQSIFGLIGSGTWTGNLSKMRRSKWSH